MIYSGRIPLDDDKPKGNRYNYLEKKNDPVDRHRRSNTDDDRIAIRNRGRLSD